MQGNARQTPSQVSTDRRDDNRSISGFLSRWRPTWLPLQDPAVVEQFGLHGRPGLFALSMAGLFALYALPPVTRATGVHASSVVILWASLSGGLLLLHHLCYRRALESAIAFHLLVFGSNAIGAAVALGFVVLGGTPQTPLWVGFTVMACINGASETRASALLGVLHILAPLVTIPFFVRLGARMPWLAVGPLTCSLIAGYGYCFLARRGQVWREERHARELREAQVRLDKAEAERVRLARDLHDSVGTTLSLVALYCSIVESQASDLAEARSIADAIRSAAASGLEDLRTVLRSLPQAPATLKQLAAELALAGGRSAMTVGSALRVEVLAGQDVQVSGTVRTTLVRAFQEGLHNALRHGRARLIHATFGAVDGTVELVISDDGIGFDMGAPTSGTGLNGMRMRAAELGGSLLLHSSPGRGSKLQLRIAFPDP